MILALDTSTHTMALALLDMEADSSNPHSVIAERSRHANRNHSILLLTEIRSLLDEAGKSMDDVQAIAVGQGPGSYTGVRVGVTAAKTLAWSLNIPLVGVSSLAALAFGVYRKQQQQLSSGSGTSWIVPCIDARRGNAYSALFAGSAKGFERVKEDRKRPLEEWIKELKEASEQEDHLSFAGEMNRIDSSIVGQLEPEQTIVEARDIGYLGAQRIRLGEQESVHAFTPNYTQQADAEVKFSTLKKHKGLR